MARPDLAAIFADCGRTSIKTLIRLGPCLRCLCTSACAMHCRFCFRQHFDYEISDKLFEEEIALIAAEPSLSEIILSGGDPLSLSDAQLRHILTALDAISHRNP